MIRAMPAHPRVEAWPERLAALIEARREAPFAWGSHDCCLFAADAVLASTGRDPAAAVRGSYASEAEAEALMLGAGGLEAFVAAAAAEAGLPEIPVAFAQRGDIALVRPGNDPAVGVVLGDRVAVVGMDRMGFLPIGAAGVLRAWAV